MEARDADTAIAADVRGLCAANHHTTPSDATNGTLVAPLLVPSRAPFIATAMTNGHIDTSDEALASLDHAALVTLLNLLYAQAKEPPISASTAVASTDDELRARIRVVRERIAGRREASPTASGRARERPTPPRATGQRESRPFAVIVTTDSALVKRARVVCQARGVVLVSVSSASALATLTTNVTPTDVIVDDRGHMTDRDADAGWLRELAARGVRVRRVEGRDRAFDALSEIE